MEFVVCALYPFAMRSERDLDLVLSVIGKRIEARRQELRDEGLEWSQEKIAAKAEVDLKQFNKIENGNAEPRIATLIQIAGALGISISTLIEGLEWIPGENRGFGHMESGD
ncbi:MAG: helix-turn-helix transcriptional regulator [Actinobacteria bacterium]|nr:helix-turn-helix transcriptional regulator [Actinomycetota bacterium]